MIQKSKQRNRDYIRLILAENGMWIKPSSPGGSSLMRAVSNCLYFTEVFHEQIQQRIIQFFLENLNRRHFNFYVNKDSAWVRLFVSHPGLPEFEHANIELIACTFWSRIKLYYISNGILCSDMYLAKGLPTLRIFKIVDGHYASLFSSEFGQLAVVAQNVVLSTLESVMNETPYSYQSLNHDKFISFEYRSWKQLSGPSPEISNQEDFLSPLDWNHFNNFPQFSIGKVTDDIAFFDSGEPLGERIVSSLKSRKKYSTPHSEHNATSPNQQKHSLQNIDRTELKDADIEVLENDYVDDLYSFILNEQFEAQHSRAPVVKAFLKFIDDSRRDFWISGHDKENEESNGSEEDNINPIKGIKNADDKSQTRSLPNRHEFNFSSEHDHCSESRDDKRPFKDFDDQFSISKSQSSNLRSVKERNSRNARYFESGDNRTTTKSPDGEAVQKSDPISMEQSKDSWLNKPQVLLHSQSLPNMDPKAVEETTIQVISEPLPEPTKVEMYSGAIKETEDLTTDSDLLTFRKDIATHSVGPKKLSLREKMQEKLKTKRLEEFNATVTSHTHSLPGIDTSPDHPVARMGSPILNPQLFSLPFNPEEAANEDPLDGGLKPAYFAKLDPQYYTGVLKFFDEKNGFGFLTLHAEDATEDIFVYRNEFDKAKISMEALRVLKTGGTIRLSFQITRYTGKYKESKKASSLKLLNE